ELHDVRLLDGPFRVAQERNALYMLSLEPDRLLHNFRVNAGLTPKAAVYGGWESEEPWVDIRCHGHTLGHYLSAIAMQYASTGDARFAERCVYIVGELRACQRARGDGLVCAFPDGSKPLDDSVAGRPFAGVPWYTMHKIFAGLRDAHVCAETPDALTTLVALTEWAANATRTMTEAQMQHMLDTEHGGMAEVLADVSALANEPKYLALAKRFAHQKVLTPLAEGRDVLDGLHSNTQIPKFVSFQRLHELTNDATYGAAAKTFWTTVTNKRSYATGGNGDGEHFFPITEFAKRLGSAKTMETCCTHNMLRLTRALFTEAPNAAFGDYYERALYNGILASQDPDSGMMTYFQATRPGYVRLYHTPVESFWCCTGTGVENHAKYGDSIYFHDADALYVNLFIPSTVAWRDKGLTLTQTTRFPETDTTRLVISASKPVRASLRIRKPSWCDAVTLTVNGRTVPATPNAEGYIAIDREWRARDTIEVRLPMAVRTVPLPGADNFVAFAYGPLVLAGRMGTDGVTPSAQLIKNERTSGNMLNATMEIPVLAGTAGEIVKSVRPVKGTPLAFELPVAGSARTVQLAPFNRLVHERYVLYWNVAG
ncbi:MAG: beta-L-arabinofuranosidase domain-containing protein, partial [Gemmatimonadaceae bacterium]